LIKINFLIEIIFAIGCNPVLGTTIYTIIIQNRDAERHILIS